MRRLAARLSFHSANSATVMPVSPAGVVCWSSRHRRKLTGPAYVGRGDEWHLVFANPFRHFTFHHPARLHHLIELERRAFSLSRLKSVRSISYAVKCDRV